MGAAVEVATLFIGVADNTTVTVLTPGGEGVDGALEAVKTVLFAVHFDLKGLCILVVTHLALRHRSSVTLRLLFEPFDNTKLACDRNDSALLARFLAHNTVPEA